MAAIKALLKGFIKFILNFWNLIDMANIIIALISQIYWF